jgi:hypothetical protein
MGSCSSRGGGAILLDGQKQTDADGLDGRDALVVARKRQSSRMVTRGAGLETMQGSSALVNHIVGGVVLYSGSPFELTGLVIKTAGRLVQGR